MTSPRASTFVLEPTWLLLLKDLEVSPRSVLRRAELPVDLFSRSGIALTTPEYFRLWTALEQEVGGSTFAIRLSETIKTESFHPVLFAALCSSCFAVAARRIAAYKRLVAPMEMHVLEDDQRLTVELEWIDRTVMPPPSLSAFELAFFVQLVRVGTRERVRALRVETPRPLKPAADYARFFGARVQRSERHAVTVSSEDARRPFLTANDGMWSAFEPTLRHRLADLDASATFADRVRAVLLEALPAGESSMDEVSHKLAVSKRTLQRRLREEATTFQSVLNATREDLARYYLAQTTLSGAEISYLLGFEDPNSFFRAFHAWTGQTTEQVRVAHAR